MRRTVRILLSLLVCAAIGAPLAAQQPSNWRVDLGTTAISAPDFPGARDRRLLVVPYWDVEYRDLFFSKGLDFAGVNAVRRGNLKAGATLTWDFDGREEDDAPEFAGLGDVDSTLRAKVFASWKRGLLTLSADAAQDVLGNDQGLVGSTGASLAIPFKPPWFFAPSLGVNWIDGRNATTFFGVDAAQSARSGRPEFHAGAGVRNARASLLVSRRLNERWSATGIASVRRLLGDAADSPLTPRDTETVFVFTVAARVR